MSKAQKESPEFAELQMPGWLPTAIVINILEPGERRQFRNEGKLLTDDSIHLRKSSSSPVTLQLPKNLKDLSWKPTIPPCEVIDGQHRLWAFEDFEDSLDFDLPVVAFHQLDRSWQAYLFYTINIKPKKINPSLAFDLYPLLRTEHWLEKFEGHVIYRETRAQEIVDILWAHDASPWHHHINMLGDRGAGPKMSTQNAWVRALLATFIKSWESNRSPLGGLFGAPVGSQNLVLPWNRAEQAAYLIFAGQEVLKAIEKSSAAWAKAVRGATSDKTPKDKDPAFYGTATLLNQDQGIRALLNVINDLMYVRADDLNLTSWGSGEATDNDILKEVSSALKNIGKAPFAKFVTSAAHEIASFDWRSSDAPGLTNTQQLTKAAFRGSGGYRLLRQQLLTHLRRKKNVVGKAAIDVIKAASLDSQ